MRKYTIKEYKEALREEKRRVKEKKDKTKPLKESDIQEAFVEWLQKNHPDIKHNHSPNEGKRKPWYVAYLKRMGMWKGWPDLEMLIGDRIHFMEFKTIKGRLTKEQKEFQTHCIKTGIPHAVPRSTKEAIALFQGWITP